MGRGGGAGVSLWRGRGTEEYTYARTRASIRALLDLAPKEAWVLRDGGEITVPAETLKPGDVFVVRPGEALPTDGIIKSGTSSLDESPVTGESVPVDKGPGMKVFAASINKQGALEVEVTAAFADNTLSKIIHLVEEAQERKGRAQQWIERFGRRYSPAVLAVSALFLLIPWLLDLSWEEWSLRAVVLLVAAAPCALIMSTPVAMAAGIGAAGSAASLSGWRTWASRVDQVVAFDKTGTLTHGAPAVTMSSRSTATQAGCCPSPRPSNITRAPAGARHRRARPRRSYRPLSAEAFRGPDQRRRQGTNRRWSGTSAIPICFSARAWISGRPRRASRRYWEDGKTVVLVVIRCCSA